MSVPTNHCPYRLTISAVRRYQKPSYRLFAHKKSRAGCFLNVFRVKFYHLPARERNV